MGHVSQREHMHDETLCVQLVCVPVHVSTIVAVVHFCTDDSCMARLQLFIIGTMTEPGK